MFLGIRTSQLVIMPQLSMVPNSRPMTSQKKAFVLFLVGSLCLGTRCTAKPSVSANKTEKVLIAKQLTEYFGRIVLYIGADAVRCVVEPGDMNMVCRAPSWDVVLYAKAEKKQFVI